MGRFILFGFATIGAALAYLWICGLVSKKLPRLGTALSGVVIAAVIALFVAVMVTVFTGSSRLGFYLLLPTYAAAFVVWVVYAFSRRQTP